MKIQKAELLQALEIVRPGLSNNEMIEQSTSFAFIEDRVVTYNDSLSIAHPIKSMKLNGAIRAQELYEFLKRTDNAEIDLEIKENELLLKSGRAKAGLTLQQTITLPLEDLNEEKDWHNITEDLIADIDFVKDSTSNDMSRRVLTCVHIKQNVIEASDGFQIMRLTNEVWPLDETLIPSEVIGEIKKIEPTEVAKTDGWLHFRNAEDTVLSTRILSDSYPETAGLFEVEGETITFSKDMPKILERAMVFTKQDHQLDEELLIKLKGNKLLVEGKNEYGWSKEQTTVKYSGKQAQFAITPMLLKNIINRSNTCLLGEEKIKFEGDDWEYIASLKSN